MDHSSYIRADLSSFGNIPLGVDHGGRHAFLNLARDQRMVNVVCVCR
jgi:hypothetical protein